MRILGLAGAPGSGKTTLMIRLVDEFGHGTKVRFDSLHSVQSLPVQLIEGRKFGILG